MAQIIWTKKASTQLEKAILYIKDEQGIARVFYTSRNPKK